MVAKRLPPGELERRVLDLLWASPEPLTPGAAHELLASSHEVAYTTVMTILARLHDKGIVLRERVGRAYAYRAASSKEETAAARMADLLAATTDPAVALTRFVDGLDPEQRSQLKDALCTPRAKP